MTDLQNFPDTGILNPADAAAAILYTQDGRYLVQVRDDIPGIFYPGHCGLFGGAVEEGEDFDACIRREVFEETGLSLNNFERFNDLAISFDPFGKGSVARIFFEHEVAPDIIHDIRLGEGRRAELVDARELLRNRRVTPYDAFALWQHYVVRLQP